MPNEKSFIKASLLFLLPACYPVSSIVFFGFVQQRSCGTESCSRDRSGCYLRYRQGIKHFVDGWFRSDRSNFRREQRLFFRRRCADWGEVVFFADKNDLLRNDLLGENTLQRGASSYRSTHRIYRGQRY